MNSLRYYVYDLETFPNIFVFNGKIDGSSKIDSFEISVRKNQRSELLRHLDYVKNSGFKFVGYNNLGFDYPIIHELLNAPYTFGHSEAFNLCQQIIKSQGYGFNSIKFNERLLPQIDLAKINHFDNLTKRTSLKSLQVAMSSESVEDLPFDPGINLNSEQMDTLIRYGIHDVTETEKFLNKCKHLIDLRLDLLNQGVLNGDVLNFSDVKIGTEYLIKRIGREKCFKGSKPKQTLRTFVNFTDLILPETFFRTEKFQKVLEWFKSQKFHITSEDKPHLETELGGLNFHFGLGGVHASVTSKVYESNKTHVIKDIDVSGMYVSVSVANEFAPEHLGDAFKLPYKQLKSDRDKFKKGTAMNSTLKLAGNAVYGNSNNPFSPFFDPFYTYRVTINGQLQILQLVEVLSLIPQLEIIQANTDGITVYMPKSVEPWFNLWKTDWEKNTNLKLEEVDYSKMFIRDVNNYIAVTSNNKIKLKGAYWYPKEERDYDGCWNKNFSMMVVQKVAEQMHIKGYPPELLIRIMTDPFDFMLSYKTPSGAKVYIGDKEMSKTVRYYVSTKGEPMRKVSSPKGEIGAYKKKPKVTDVVYKSVMKEIGPNVWDERIHTKNKTKYEKVTTSIESGRLVKECNLASKFKWEDVDYDYYIQEIKKLEIK